MAAWLAYLKSRLLLPEAAPGEGPSAEDMATALAERLRRLEAFRYCRRAASRASAAWPRRFPARRSGADRGNQHPQWTATLFDLLSAYASQRQRHVLAHVRVGKRAVWSLAEARQALERLIGQATDWSRFDEFLLTYLVDPAMRTTMLASSFAASLELAREGHIELHQQQAFAPLFMRQRRAAAEAAPNEPA